MRVRPGAIYGVDYDGIYGGIYGVDYGCPPVGRIVYMPLELAKPRGRKVIEKGG